MGCLDTTTSAWWSTELSSKKPDELTYDVLIENHADGIITTAIALPDCQATGATKEEALTSLYERLTERLTKAEIVTIKIEPPKAEHPWMKFAGIFKDDLDFQEIMNQIQAERNSDDESEVDPSYYS